jgi:hypothetical protein
VNEPTSVAETPNGTPEGSAGGDQRVVPSPEGVLGALVEDVKEEPAPDPEDEPRDQYDEPANEDWGHPELRWGEQP